MGLEKVGLQAVLEGADKYAADAKKIRAAEQGIVDSEQELANSARQLAQTQNQLALAEHNLQDAATQLAQAEQELADNTDPEKQRELEGAVLQARVALDSEQNTVNALQGEMLELGSSTTEAADATEQAGFSFTELNSVISLVQRGVQAARQVYDAIIAPTLELAAAQRELALAGQITVEEAGKIIQIGDDLGISVSTLKTAFREMAKDGIQPTLENIKEIAKEYQNAETPTEALQIAQRSLGKSYQELLPLLEKTPAELDAMAASAEAAGLIMSSAAVKGAREYEIALDDLQDQLLGVKVALGQAALPVLTDFLRKTSEAAQLTRVMNQAVASGNLNWFEMQVIAGKVTYGLMSASDAIELVNSKMDQSVPAIGGWGAAWQGATKSIQGAVGPIQEIVSEEEAFKSASELLQISLSGPVRNALLSHSSVLAETSPRIRELRAEIAKYQEMQGKTIKVVEEATTSQLDLDLATHQNAESIMRLSEAQHKLAENTDPEKQFALEGALLRAQKALEGSNASVQKLNEGLGSSKLATLDYSDKIKGLQSELDAQTGKINEADAALKNEIQTLILSTLTAQASSTDQIAAITQIAESWGFLDKKTSEVVTGTLSAWDSFTTGQTTLAGFKRQLDGVTSGAMTFTPNAGEMQHALDAIAASGSTATTSLKNVKTGVDNVSATKPNAGEIQHALDAIGSSGSNSKGLVDDLIRSLNSIPTEVTSTITTVFNEVGRSGRAEGGPVFPNQTYRVNEGGLQESMLSRRGLELLQGSTLRPRTPGFVIPADRTRALMSNPALGGGRGTIAAPVDMSRQVSVTANIYNQMSQAVFEQRLKAAIG